MFNPGDRVICTATTTIWTGYIGATGTVISSSRDNARVKPDRKMPDDEQEWWFNLSLYTLELVDDSASHIPEDWS